MDLERINELGFEKTSKWMAIVLIVSFSKWWNLLITLQCYVLFFTCSSSLAFHFTDKNIVILNYSFDMVYLFEIIFTISYRCSSRYMKLRHGFGRSWICIVVDIFSVVPFEVFYAFHYISDRKNDNLDVLRALSQNRLLRVYRIFQLESLYGITVRKPMQYLIFLTTLFLSKAFLLAHMLTCVWVNLKTPVSCNSTDYSCFVWHELNMANLIILNWDGKKEVFDSNSEHLLAAIGVFSGMVLIYAYFYPFILLVVLQLNHGQIYYYDRYRKLIRFLKNMIARTDVRKKILKNYLDAWQSTTDMRACLENIPLAMRKEIFTDMYWDAFRHSELLRSATRNCKRSLSLVMATHYYHAGEVIYLKGQNKDTMLFLVQGIVEVMAEENEKSPLLSFSSGTVFGELSLFLCTPSQAIVKCKSYCEFQTLSLTLALAVLKDYPKDKRSIFQRLQQRIVMARYTQWRKNEFVLKNKGVFGADSNVEDCVKWLKTQWSAVWEGHKRRQMVIKAIKEGQRVPAYHRTAHPEVKVEFISNYLELLVLSDAFEEKRDAVCLRTKFPWSIDPSASFLNVWRKFILLMSVVPNILYPLCTAWLPKFPRAVYEFSFVLTGIFMVDVLLKLFTAVKTKHVIHTHFTDVLKYRLREMTFYLDIIAAFPYQIFIMLHHEKLKTYEIGLLLHPAILKSHVLLRLPIRLGRNMDKITLIKNCIIYVFLVYWLAEIIQLFCVKDQYDLSGDTWINRFLKDRENALVRKYLLSVIDALTISLGIPDFLMYRSKISTVIFTCIFKYFFFFFFCFYLGDFYGSYVIRIFSHEMFLVLLKRIIKFLNSVHLNKKLAERLMNTVKFQWYYDNADYLSSEVPIIKATPFDLKNQIYKENIFKTLRQCKMFESESLECLIAIMDKSLIVAVPAGSSLVSYGHTSHMVSILHRGVCQINSFLEKDTVAGLGWPIVVNPGTAFPLLSSFCNAPAPVGVISLTDSELIMIHLDDLLKIFIDFNILKDVLDVLKDLNLLTRMKEVKPGLTLLTDKGNWDESVFNEPKKPRAPLMRCLVSLFNLCFGGHHFSDMRFIKVWEALFVCYMIFLSIFWPTCFGLFAFSSYFLLPLLIASKLVIVFNFLVGFRSPYYNRIGIKVTHPFLTPFNYLTSSFILDFICFCPLYEVYRYVAVDSMTVPPTWLVVVSFTQLFVKILQLLTFFDSLEYVINSKYTIRMIKIVLSVLLAFNLYINLMMFVLADWTYASPYRVTRFHLPEKYRPSDKRLFEDNSLYDYYVMVWFWLLCSLNSTAFNINFPQDIQLYTAYALSLIGTVLHLYMYCVIASYSFFAYLGKTMFQEKITSFVKFLEMENTNDKVIEHALSYYNYEWSKTRGENMKKTFERLPTHLHEELVYPLYRATLRKSEVFSHADEGFYKILAKYICCVYFNRGSVITFKNEVQSNLYFLHKGRCFVYDWFLKLDTGSVIGDLQRTGVMKNKIYALTNVELLRISSNDFFMVINNFDVLEANFFRVVTTLESFLRCSAPPKDFQLHPVDSKDVLHAFGLQDKVIGFEDESYFEETDKSSIFMRRRLKYTKADDKWRLFTIYPDTWKMKVYILLLQIDASLTFIIVPFLMSFATLSVEAFSFVAVLDFFWFLGIILSFRVGYIDKVKGDVVTDFKFVARHYVNRLDGFVLDVLALIPFEAFYLAAVTLEKADPLWVSVLRSLRLLRVSCLVRGLRIESQKLKTNHFMIYINLVLYLIMGTVGLGNAVLMLAADPPIREYKNDKDITRNQLHALVIACEHVLNVIGAANLWTLTPSTRPQMIFSIIVGFLNPYIKAVLMSRVLSIMHAKGLAQLTYKSQVVALESYLVSRDTSPIIVSSVRDYKFNLLEFGRSENMPLFLVKCPTHLRISIMRDLYLCHLQNCPLFAEVNTEFLEQLLARMNREIYFSGQLIVEQFDVDHRMYFIHRGEVYIINQTKTKAYVEKVVGIMLTGQYFGEGPGLWFSRPHAFTYRARTLVEVVVLHSDDWMDLRRSFPKASEIILNKAKALRII